MPSVDGCSVCVWVGLGRNVLERKGLTHER